MRPVAQGTRQGDAFAVALILFTSLFVGFTVPVGLFLIDWTSMLGPVYFIGFQIMLVGTAYDLTEALLAIALKPEYLPRRSLLDDYPPVALLITVCDDVIPDVLKHLSHQTYSNCDIFVLDDSSNKTQRRLVDQSGYETLRRGTRRGYKAGNLNHWLDLHGEHYKYMVILDSDSLIPDDFVVRMVEYAEHPQNGRVGLFQSKILPWAATTRFSRVIGAPAPVRMQILERVANRTDTLLSWGHNNLIRTEYLLQVGGFHEYVTAEDTALSLMLNAQGYTIKLVDVLSYDTDPQDVFRYARRTIRWAKQTVELFRLPWRSSSLRLKLLLCYHVYNYLIGGVFLALLLLSAWTFRADSWYLPDLAKLVTAAHPRTYFAPWFLVLLAMTGVWIVQTILRFFLAIRAGVQIRDIFLNSLLSSSLMYFLVFPLGMAMLRTALGTKISFTPTNTATSEEPTLQAIISYMLPSLVCGGLIVIGIALYNRYLIFSLNSLWLLILLVAPVVLRLFHTNEADAKGQVNNEPRNWT